MFCHLSQTVSFASVSGLGDSNARPLRPERSALPTALNPVLKIALIFQKRCKVTFFLGIKQ